MRCVWKSKSLPGLCFLPFSKSSRYCEFYKILRNANAHQSLSCLYCKTAGMLKFRISSIMFINSIHICLLFFFFFWPLGCSLILVQSSSGCAKAVEQYVQCFNSLKGEVQHQINAGCHWIISLVPGKIQGSMKYHRMCPFLDYVCLPFILNTLLLVWLPFKFVMFCNSIAFRTFFQPNFFFPHSSSQSL